MIPSRLITPREPVKCKALPLGRPPALRGTGRCPTSRCSRRPHVVVTCGVLPLARGDVPRARSSPLDAASFADAAAAERRYVGRTTTLLMADSIAALIPGLQALANPPASADSLDRAQAEFGRMPADVRVFYEHMDGTREMTPLEQAAIRFWALSEWKPVTEETTSDLYSELASAPVVADHMIDSWWYALDCSPSSPTFGAVFLVDGASPAVSVAPSFTDFIRAVLSDDWSLYPR
jgi:hypothetical protein